MGEVEGNIRFQKAGSGDHLCSSFKCPDCQSQTIRGQDIDTSLMEDDIFEFACIRATLDKFCSYSSEIVSTHLTQVKLIEGYVNTLDIAK